MRNPLSKMAKIPASKPKSHYQYPNSRIFRINILANLKSSQMVLEINGFGYYKERGTNNLVILDQPFFHQTTLFFCE